MLVKGVTRIYDQSRIDSPDKIVGNIVCKDLYTPMYLLQNINMQHIYML